MQIFGLNFVYLYKYIRENIPTGCRYMFIQKRFRRKPIDFCELYPTLNGNCDTYLQRQTNYMPLRGKSS